MILYIRGGVAGVCGRLPKADIAHIPAERGVPETPWGCPGQGLLQFKL